MHWNAGSHSYQWGREHTLTRPPSTLVMGILNVTPDSFSDGGRFVDVDAAVSHALKMVDDGANIIDVGGESTRPGADAVSSAVELERTIPVIRALSAHSAVNISIDTTKSSVARAAIEAGASIVNDVSAMTHDPSMLEVAAEYEAGIVLMHMRGRPKDMQTGDLSDPDMTSTVVDYLRKRMDALSNAGVSIDRIALDPGIGFGKTVEQNISLISSLNHLVGLGRPIMLGVSRKSMLGAITGRPVEERLAATCAAHVIGIQNGAHILRVHDVAEARDVILVNNALAQAGSKGGHDGRT